MAWYREDRCVDAGDERPSGPPDLAVEVLSIDLGAELFGKYDDYDRAGVGEVWLIEPCCPAAVLFRFTGRPDADASLGPDGMITSLRLPGFSVRIADLTRR